MNKLLSIVLSLLIVCAISAGCENKENAGSHDESTLADQLNDSNAVIGAGDIYDSVIYLEGEQVDIQLMRVFSSYYYIDYPFNQFNYISTEAGDFFNWHLDDPDQMRNYVRIYTSSEPQMTAADNLETALLSDFAVVERSFVQLNYYNNAQHIFCSSPLDNTVIPSDATRNYYVLSAECGSVIAEACCTLESLEGIYQYMYAMLETIEPTYG